MGVQLSLMEVQATGSDNNSGLFDTQASMTSTLSATSANTASPVVTASNYTFTANDVGHFLYVKPSGSWKSGWYKIASVTSGAATLIASIGSVFGGDKQPNTTEGISTSTTATSGIWAVDYTQKNTSFISYTDLVAVTASQLTSAANPFTPNLIGNSIQILSGTGFPPNIYIISSLTGSAANFHTNFATPGSTGGTGNLGGALATVHKACGFIGISDNYVYVKGSAGVINVSSNASSLIGRHCIIGYQNNRWDNLKASIRLGASGTRFLISGDGRYAYLHNLIIDGQGYSDTRATSFGNNQRSYVYNCEFRNLTYGLFAQGGFQVDNCIFENITTSPFGYTTGQLSRCIFKNCSGSVGNPSTVDRCIFFGGSSYIYISNNTGQITNNTFYNIAADGIYFYSNYSANNTNTTIIYNNIFSNISGYGIHYQNSGTQFNLVSKNNAYFACTSGNFYNGRGNDPNIGYLALVSQIQLSSSPFVNPSAGDLRLNNDLTGGRLCRGASISSNGIVTPNNDAIDLGAVQTTSYAADKTLGPLSKTVDIKANTTAYSEYINLASTGYSFSTATLKAYYVRPNLTATSISLASQTVNGAWISGGFVEVDPINMPGLYRFDVPNEVIASGVSNSILQIVNTANNDRVNINYKFLDSQILDLTQSVPTTNTDQTVGDAFNAARAYGFGKWAINGNTLEYYTPDNLSIMKSFDLDNPYYPKQKGGNTLVRGLILNYDPADILSYPGTGTIIYDLSGRANHGTLSSSSIVLGSGTGKYIDCNGSSYVGVSSNSFLNFTNSLTISMFVYIADWTNTSTARFMSKAEGGGYSFIIDPSFDSTKVSFILRDDSVYRVVDFSKTSLTGWQHITATFDGRYAKIYRNGILQSTYDKGSYYNITYLYPNNYMFLGTEAGSGSTNTSPYLQGRIGITHMYNVALNQDEITNLFNQYRSRYGL